MSSIYPGEEIREAAGYPALVKIQPGRSDGSLVVFITGGGVLARIAYGHPQGRPADFLAHWLGQAGHPFLAVSYPLDHPLFDAVYPEFSVRDWGEQTADIIAQVIEEQGLSRQVIVLGWSMAGRIAEPLNAALMRRNIAIELFVAMAASAALPGLLPALDRLQPSTKGLARIDDGFLGWLLLCLHGQNALAGHELVPDEIFRTEFTGDLPVNLATTALRYRKGKFAPDLQADMADIGTSNYAGFPPLALMTHLSPLDARHALMDRAIWSFYISQVLCERYLWPHAQDLASLPTDRWQRIVETVREAPDRLCITLRGNHLFFLGEQGAREAVSALGELRSRAQDLSRALREISTSD